MPRVQAPRQLGTVIRGRRKDLGWSQSELARRAGVSRWWVGQLENGRSGAALDLVLRTLDALGLVVDLSPVDGPGSVGGQAAVDLDALLDAHARPDTAS